MSFCKIRSWVVLLFILFQGACFGTDKRGGVLRYSGGEVTTGTGHFTVGGLPPDWKGPRIRLKQLVFENDKIDGTILTDALCGPKFDDAPLLRLAKDLFQPLNPRTLEEEKEIQMAGRSGLKLLGDGSLDGVPIRMEAVVLKKDFCLYDFVYFAPPSAFPKGVKDFEAYLYGFQTR